MSSPPPPVIDLSFELTILIAELQFIFLNMFLPPPLPGTRLASCAGRATPEGCRSSRSFRGRGDPKLPEGGVRGQPRQVQSQCRGNTSGQTIFALWTKAVREKAQSLRHTSPRGSSELWGRRSGRRGSSFRTSDSDSLSAHGIGRGVGQRVSGSRAVGPGPSPQVLGARLMPDGAQAPSGPVTGPVSVY